MASSLQRTPLFRRREIFAAVVAAQDCVPPGYMVCEQLQKARERVRELYGITPTAMEAILTEGVMHDFPPFHKE
jgi:hypothetical protein